MLKKLAKDIQVQISFDNVREEKIMDELLFNNILCEDVLVFEDDIHNMEVAVVVRMEDKNKPIISNAVSKICKKDMIVNDVISSVKPGWCSLNLRTAPKYDCAFGVSTQSKQKGKASGDCYSVLRLDANKFMFAVCDGMGSGEKANRLSETAINLVENFYRAGFEDELVISSANKLLNLQKEDVFSAIDICVVDLNTGLADFVKMGSPNCFVLSKDKCEIIEGRSLPLGIVNQSDSTNKKEALNSGDFIILLSDGVSDSFSSDAELTHFICSLDVKNPQGFSDALLKKALDNNQGITKDDMTVLVVKIF